MKVPFGRRNTGCQTHIAYCGVYFLCLASVLILAKECKGDFSLPECH